MTLDDKINYYENMAENSSVSAKEYRELADWLIELREFKNGKNWTRSYDHKGDLVNEFALYLPKIEGKG